MRSAIQLGSLVQCAYVGPARKPKQGNQGPGPYGPTLHGSNWVHLSNHRRKQTAPSSPHTVLWIRSSLQLPAIFPAILIQGTCVCSACIAQRQYCLWQAIKVLQDWTPFWAKQAVGCAAKH